MAVFRYLKHLFIDMLIITVFRYLKHLFIERRPVKIDLYLSWKFSSSPSVYFARSKLWLDTI